MSICEHTIGIEYERPNYMGGALIGYGAYLYHKMPDWFDKNNYNSVVMFPFCPDCGVKLEIEAVTIKSGECYKTTFIEKESK